MNRENFIQELIIKVFEELEKQKRGEEEYKGYPTMDDCLEDTTSPRTGREKEKWCCPDLMTVGKAEAAVVGTKMSEQETRSLYVTATAVDDAMAGLLCVSHTLLLRPLQDFMPKLKKHDIFPLPTFKLPSVFQFPLEKLSGRQLARESVCIKYQAP